MAQTYLSNALEQLPAIEPQHESISNPYYQEYLTLKNKQWMFSDLLPMDKEKTILVNNKQKISVLNQLYHFYQTSSKAIKEFYIQRRLDLFDAHVGESSCQLRAIKLSLMLQNINIATSTKALYDSQKYSSHAKIIKCLLNQYRQQNHKQEGRIKLSEFILKHNINDTLPTESMFLLCCYILNKFKKIINIDKDVIDFKRIATLWNLSKSLSEKLPVHLQKLCSLISIDFALKHGSKTDHYQHLPYLLTKDSYNRWVLPAIEITEVMLDIIQEKSLPIIFDVVRLNQSDKELGNFQIIFLNNRYHLFKKSCFHNMLNKPHLPVILFQSFFIDAYNKTPPQQHLNKIQKINALNLIRMSLSTHSQYPGEKLAPYAQYPYHIAKTHINKNTITKKTSILRDLQANALSLGVCKGNPTTQALSHIMCSTLHLMS